MIRIQEAKNQQIEIVPNDLDENLCILWNVGSETELTIDGQPYSLMKDCVLFISEFHMKIQGMFEKVRTIQFNKSFLSPAKSMNDMGNYLMIFYGNHMVNSIPKISLREIESLTFNQIWDNMNLEYKNIANPISEALVRNSFQRLMLLSQKIHMETEFDLPMEFSDLRIIREFQYLVELNFMQITKVSDYAKLLNVTPKKISQLFGCCFDKKASELITNRRNLYAKNTLVHTQELVKNIAFNLSFSDSQSFSHFFKKHNGVSPEEYRKMNGVVHV